MCQDVWCFRLVPNVISYLAATSACEEGQQCERALDLLREMWRPQLELAALYAAEVLTAGLGVLLAGGTRSARVPWAPSAVACLWIGGGWKSLAGWKVCARQGSRRPSLSCLALNRLLLPSQTSWSQM